MHSVTDQSNNILRPAVEVPSAQDGRFHCQQCGYLHKAKFRACIRCGRSLQRDLHMIPPAKPSAPPRRPFFCSCCGQYNLPTFTACVGCGRMFAHHSMHGEAKPRLSGTALAGFILAFFTPVLAMLVSIAGATQIHKSHGQLIGSAIAAGGILVSGIQLLPAVLSWMRFGPF